LTNKKQSYFISEDPIRAFLINGILAGMPFYEIQQEIENKFGVNITENDFFIAVAEVDIPRHELKFNQIVPSRMKGVITENSPEMLGKRAAKESDGDVRYFVAEGLYNNKDFDTLKTMINDSDRDVRYWVGLGLVDTEDWNTLQEFLKKEEDSWVKNEVEEYKEGKEMAREASLKFSKKYTHEEIEKIKESGSNRERRKLAWDLYLNKDYDTLKTMIDDSDNNVRRWVVEGLLHNKDYDTLKTMINDSYDEVRYGVAMGLYDNKDYDTLKTMINDSSGDVRDLVARGLVDTEDWNTLQEFLEKEKDEDVKNSVEQYTADKILEKHFGSLKFSVTSAPKKGTKRYKVLELLSDGKEHLLEEIYSTVGCTYFTIRPLENKGLITMGESEIKITDRGMAAFKQSGGSVETAPKVKVKKKKKETPKIKQPKIKQPKIKQPKKETLSKGNFRLSLDGTLLWKERPIRKIEPVAITEKTLDNIIKEEIEKALVYAKNQGLGIQTTLQRIKDVVGTDVFDEFIGERVAKELYPDDASISDGPFTTSVKFEHPTSPTLAVPGKERSAPVFTYQSPYSQSEISLKGFYSLYKKMPTSTSELKQDISKALMKVYHHFFEEDMVNYATEQLNSGSTLDEALEKTKELFSAGTLLFDTVFPKVKTIISRMFYPEYYKKEGRIF